MDNKKPILIVIEGHAKSGKNTYANLLIERFKTKNVSLRDLRNIKKHILPNPTKNKKTFEKKCTSYYKELTNELTSNVTNSIIVKWTRNERISALIDNRPPLDYILFEDSIYELYNVVTVTLLFVSYADYIERCHYMLSENPKYSVQDFDEITACYFEEYSGYKINESYIDTEEDFIDEDEDNEDILYLTEEELEELKQEYLENPYEDQEILVDIFSDFKESEKGLEEAWDYLYPLVCADIPHEAPNNSLNILGNFRN